MEHFLACHEHAFQAFGGVPTKIMVDNLKSAVLQRLAGVAPVFNARYADFARHYGFTIAPCNVRRADEVVINEQFARANGFGLASRFKAILNGRLRELSIVGIALSPEFIYAIGPGDLMPDDQRFCIMWISYKALAGVFDLEGAFNNVALSLLPAPTRTRS